MKIERIFYDFYHFCNTGEFKVCSREDKDCYPCTKVILITWSEKFNKNELLRIADKMKMGTNEIKPKNDFCTKLLDPKKKINFCCVCINRK
tara:strand:- start:2021 stop:2293 length:273 start_codon:yes stop_codon:yes gene_type:complete